MLSPALAVARTKTAAYVDCCNYGSIDNVGVSNVCCDYSLCGFPRFDRERCNSRLKKNVIRFDTCLSPLELKGFSEDCTNVLFNDCKTMALAIK